MTSSPQASEAPIDLQFIDTLIAHDQTAIDAAQLVATRAQHQELKLLARSIITDRQEQISELRKWRTDWFGNAPQAVNMDLPGIRNGLRSVNLDKLDPLKEDQFDLEFILQMLPLEEGSLTAARYLLTQDVHVELKQLAQNLIEEQETEIQQMRGWQTKWNK